jgi:hypothetical protein
MPVQAEEKLAAIELSYAFKPVLLLRQAIASFVGASVDASTATRSFAPTVATTRNEQALSVDFSSRHERDRVSLILAESQVRVRLGQDLQLHCEVSSTDEVDREPELGIDLALQFRFK